MLYFILVYILFFLSFYFNIEVLFLNEEFLIAVSMIFVFVFLIRAMGKLINFSFFLRVEQIYFLFLSLIVLNIKLIDKMLKLVNFEIFRLESLTIFQLHSFLLELSNEMIASLKTLNHMFLKNFFYSFINYLHLFNFYFLTDVFVIKNVIDKNNKLFKGFLAFDSNKTFVTKTSSVLLLDVLTIDDYITTTA